MPSCNEVSKLLSDRLDRKLGAAEWVRLRVHLTMCSACSRVERQLHFLRKALSGLVEPRDQSGPDRK
jgi:predicted anti-sigma-YlaC factor YlaD